ALPPAPGQRDSSVSASAASSSCLTNSIAKFYRDVTDSNRGGHPPQRLGRCMADPKIGFSSTIFLKDRSS
ncbi:MAG: hypothetical protein LBG66_04020, partial [Gallionellaceae bacterium]|nr:hypothetical protein [Gallionellaceae bacterium]